MNAIAQTFAVEPSEAGTRLDRWLADRLDEADFEVSRSQIQAWIKGGFVIGPNPRIKASDLVQSGDTYRVNVPGREPITIAADDIAIDIVYEDGDVIVVNKPRGLVVHPAAGHERGTLINALVHRGVSLSPLGGGLRPGVVHRIDKDTSGLVMFAKTDLAYHRLAEQLREHTVRREYVAIVHGVIGHSEGTIEAPIGRDPKNRQRMAVVESGKPAVTHFHVTERFPAYTVVACGLETGRTHQIRVHFAYIGHPLAGDPLYGRRHTLPIDGQALHARTLGFDHPKTGAPLEFVSPLPDDMERLLNGLRTGVLV